jgi:Cu-Zn family superoxide dismutase
MLCEPERDASAAMTRTNLEGEATMTRTGMLCILLFTACGGSSKSVLTPVSQTEVGTTAGAEDLTNANLPLPPTDEPVQAPPPEIAPPAPHTAEATLLSVKNGAAVGTVTIELGDDNILAIRGMFNDLQPGSHAIYIHEGGDCGNKAKNIGGHLNPANAKHGTSVSSARHAGDFGNINVDKAGNAVFTMNTDSLSMEAGRADTLAGRTVVIHAKKDNKKGDAGAPLACGVIKTKR